MGFASYIGSIASVVRKNKKQKHNRKYIRTAHQTHNISKDQHLNWIEEGKCQCCGAESGEHKGICDECRLS
jgi:hypothetical protein